MAKAKKSKPRVHRERWSISLIQSTPAKYLDVQRKLRSLGY
jgi:hypothetical protein